MEKESFEDLKENSSFKLPKDAGLYWIHCNRCFELYIHKRKRILMLSCNHMICETCATTPTINHINISSEVNCPICKKLQRYRVLCNVMPAHAKQLLNPEPWREPNERILNFQAKHRESFKNGMIRRQFELGKIEKKCQALEIIAKQKYERYEQLRNQRKQLERKILKMKKLKLQPKRTYFQDPVGNATTNGILQINSLPGVKRANTSKHSNTGGDNLTHAGQQKSFSFELF